MTGPAADRLLELLGALGGRVQLTLKAEYDEAKLLHDIVRSLVPKIVLVSEQDLRAAIAGTAVQERLIVEGAGAAGVAAVLAGTLDVRDRRVAIVLSGGNIDQDKLKAIL